MPYSASSASSSPAQYPTNPAPAAVVCVPSAGSRSTRTTSPAPASARCSAADAPRMPPPMTTTSAIAGLRTLERRPAHPRIDRLHRPAAERRQHEHVELLAGERQVGRRQHVLAGPVVDDDLEPAVRGQPVDPVRLVAADPEAALGVEGEAVRNGARERDDGLERPARERHPDDARHLR